jgi:hypothetical protein
MVAVDHGTHSKHGPVHNQMRPETGIGQEIYSSLIILRPLSMSSSFYQ